MEQILIKGMKFQTFDGKQVLFNGINVVCKTKSQDICFPIWQNHSSHFMRWDLT